MWVVPMIGSPPIPTAVEKVAVRFGKPDEEGLDALTPERAPELADAGEFGKGSMEPKVLAAATFAESKPGRSALITLLEKARDGIDGKRVVRLNLRGNALDGREAQVLGFVAAQVHGGSNGARAGQHKGYIRVGGQLCQIFGCVLATYDG